MKTIQVADIICILRKKWTPLAERQLKGDAEDILSNAAEATLKRSKKLTTWEHVKHTYVQSIYQRIKNELKRRNKLESNKGKYISNFHVIYADIYDWGFPDRYELRQALNIALGTLRDNDRLAIWRIYVIGEGITTIKKTLKITYLNKIYLRITLNKLGEHPALSPWKPKKK